MFPAAQTSSHQLPGGTAAVSPSGGVVLSGGADGCVVLHDAELRALGAQQQHQLWAHDMAAQGVSAACFSADGSCYLTAGSDGSVFTWRAPGEWPAWVAVQPLAGSAGGRSMRQGM